jgi:hypothetical protein
MRFQYTQEALDPMHNLNAGIADEYVHTAMARNNVGHCALNLALVRDIHADCDRRTTAAANFVGH